MIENPELAASKNQSPMDVSLPITDEPIMHITH